MLPPWLTFRRVVAIVLVQVLIFGIIGIGTFAYFGDFRNEGNSNASMQFQNFKQGDVVVEIKIVDKSSNEREFDAKFKLGTEGVDAYYLLDWPTIAPGEKNLTVTVGENRSKSYEFDADKYDNGPNLSVNIKEEIEFIVRSS